MTAKKCYESFVETLTPVERYLPHAAGLQQLHRIVISHPWKEDATPATIIPHGRRRCCRHCRGCFSAARAPWCPPTAVSLNRPVPTTVFLFSIIPFLLFLLLLLMMLFLLSQRRNNTRQLLVFFKCVGYIRVHGRLHALSYNWARRRVLDGSWLQLYDVWMWM